MKTICLPLSILLILFISWPAAGGYAQTPVPEFGAATIQEFQLKECSFDKTADAVVFFDWGRSDYDDEYNLITQRRIRFKVLKESGIQRGNIRILFYSKDQFEFITGIEAVVLTPGQNNSFTTTSLDRKTVFTRKVNELQSEVVFALPNVKVGSIVEYKYKSIKKHYGGLDDWYFQKDIPVNVSSYTLYILPNTTFNYLVQKSDFMHLDVWPSPETGSVVFEMKNIPGLRDEAYSTAYRKYLQRVGFQLSSVKRYGTERKFSNTWKELNRDFLDSREFAGQLNKNISTPAGATWVSFAEPFKKMQSIHNYVRNNFQWSHIHSLHSAENLKTIVDRKKGNAADLNLLLINLLKDQGLEAYPMLVSERWHGAVDTIHSFQDQFNKVVALVYLDNKKYVLDATDPYTPSNMIPTELLNTMGFVVDKKQYGFLRLADEKEKKLYVINLSGNVEKNGMVKGTAAVDYYSYARIGMADRYKNNKQKYADQFSATGLKIDSFMVDGLDADSMKLGHRFTMEYGLGRSGTYSLLNYNFFMGFEKNPFISDYRFTDIDFGAKSHFILNGTFNIPDGMVVDALPKNITLRTPDKGLQVAREIQQQENTVEVRIRIEFNTTLYDAGYYSTIKTFFGKMIELLNEPIVLKAR